MDKIYSIDEIRNQLKPIFDAYPVYTAVLFGSYAKGKATEVSDIDIVIDSRGELLNMAFYGVLEEAVHGLQKNVDLFEISELRKDVPIFNEILKEGILLYDKQG